MTATLAIATLVFSAVAAPANPGPPINDECTGALVVDGNGPHPFDNSSATVGLDEQALCCTFSTCLNGQDVWYLWTAPCTAVAELRTCGSAVDTKIAVYSAPCPPTEQNILACNEDSCGLQSVAPFKAEAGRQYLLRIGTFIGSPGGSGQFTIRCEPCPCDFTPDGRLDSQDFFDFLRCLLDQPCAAADINTDGFADSRDFFDFLACFFAPPPSCP